LTFEEYDQLEIRTGERYEYHDGEVFAMSGASGAHARITANISREVGVRIQGTSCSEHSGELRVAIPQRGKYLHPDLTVACGDLEPETPGRQAYTNPKVIFEVLSTSTEAYDRSAKFDLYSRIPTFQEYVLISQDRYAIDRFSRKQLDDPWRLFTYRGEEAILELESLAISIPLAGIYDRVNFNFADRPPVPFEVA
jgi:Uma2 family endonuclease